MEGITEIDKTAYIDECKEIVRNELDEELSDEMLTIVTNEIMDTCLFIGGDFKKENIIDRNRNGKCRYIDVRRIPVHKRGRIVNWCQTYDSLYSRGAKTGKRTIYFLSD